MQDSLGIGEVIEYRAVNEPIDVEPAIPAELTLPGAVVESLRHDPQLQAALARLEGALADARQARLLPNPIVSVVARFPEGGGSPTIEAGLSIELLRLLYRPRQISAADNRLRAAGSDVLTLALDRVAVVQQRYAAIQAIDAEMENLRQRQTLVNRLLAIARSRAAAGESSRLDVLTFDAERVRIEAELLGSQAERRDERLALARLLGRPSDAAEWSLTPWQAMPLVSSDERTWINTALEHRPEVQSQQWELAALGDESAAAKWAALEGAEGGVDSERDDGNWSIGPGISAPLPLLDWGQARRAKSAAAQVEARHKLLEAQRQVVEDVRRALAGARMSQQSLDKVALELIPLLERRHEQATSAYQVGEADFTTVLLAEQELQEARSNRIALERRVAEAHLRLQRAVGGAGVAATIVPTTQPATDSNNRGTP